MQGTSLHKQKLHNGGSALSMSTCPALVANQITQNPCGNFTSLMKKNHYPSLIKKIIIQVWQRAETHPLCIFKITKHLSVALDTKSTNKPYFF